MRKLVAGAALVIALAGCGGDPSTEAEPEAEVTEEATRLGNPAVYERIGALTDCPQLQKEFDTAAANHEFAKQTDNLSAMETSTSFMRFTVDRMEEVGCP